jgi:hypothetical protein
MVFPVIFLGTMGDWEIGNFLHVRGIETGGTCVIFEVKKIANGRIVPLHDFGFGSRCKEKYAI